MRAGSGGVLQCDGGRCAGGVLGCGRHSCKVGTALACPEQWAMGAVLPSECPWEGVAGVSGWAGMSCCGGRPAKSGNQIRRL